MNKKVLSALIAGTALMAFAANKGNDPVLMTVNGNDVRLSEFEYLYNKNNSQQLQPLTFDEYVGMFVDYKLKVADALAQGVDTTAAFKQEFQKFRDELAGPYLRDEQAMQRLIDEAYSWLGREVYVSHIMLAPEQQMPGSKQKLDSIRSEILAGNITFEDAARKYSVDKGSAQRGGRMAWISGDTRLPWQFMEASYSTPVGEISEVINSGYGFHIVRPDESRAPRGEVNAQHILLMTRGMDAEQTARQKAKIDSIYTVVTTPGVDFGEVASRLSEDPGSAKRGGELGWFGSGRMVAEFDSVAFAIADGAISEPFATAYGYHIIHKLGHRGDTIPALEDAREGIEQAIASDSRANIPVEAKIDEIAAATGSAIDPGIGAAVTDVMNSLQYEVCDSTVIAALRNCTAPAMKVNGIVTTIGEVVAQKPIRMGGDLASTIEFMQAAAKQVFDNQILEVGRQQLLANNAEYRNLVNEYRDGIMLFEVSNQKVWDKAAKDTAGQEAYFQAHRDKYVWEAQNYKAIVIFPTNDSILGEAKQFASRYDAANLNAEKFISDIKAQFGKNIKVERVIAAKGENAITDYLGFGGPKPELKNQRWTEYFAFADKVIEQPEEAIDVKGLVVTDYQNQLEKEWLTELHAKYPVSINQKVLKKAKK